MPKPIEVDIEKLRMKFSALNIDFNGPSLDFLGSRMCTRALKSGTPVKVLWKRLQIGMGTTSTCDELFSGINVNDR